MNERMKPLKIGVLGCGTIARIAHLPNLCKLHNYFTLCAVCDSDPATLSLVSSQYPQVHAHTSLTTFLREPLEAVLISTSGSHVEEIRAVAEAGLHMFIEKPLCLTYEQAQRAMASVKHAGITAMVGYMKRFSPGVQYGRELLKQMHHLQFVQVQLWHPPQERYFVPHHSGLADVSHNEAFLASLKQRIALADEAKALKECLGQDVSMEQKIVYTLLVASGIHDINLMRTLFGNVQKIEHVHVWNQGLSGSTQLVFANDVRTNFTWLFLPSGSYHERFDVVADNMRLTLRFPSPYVLSAPVNVIWEQVGDQGELLEHRSTVSYAEAFQLELEDFYRCVLHGEVPQTSLEDASEDLSCIRDIIRAITI